MEDIRIELDKLPFAIVHKGQQTFIEYPGGATKEVSPSLVVAGRTLEKLYEMGVKPEREITEESFDQELKDLVDKVNATKSVKSRK